VEFCNHFHICLHDMVLMHRGNFTFTFYCLLACTCECALSFHITITIKAFSLKVLFQWPKQEIVARYKVNDTGSIPIVTYPGSLLFQRHYKSGWAENDPSFMNKGAHSLKMDFFQFL
jgi:hypothetical protein